MLVRRLTTSTSVVVALAAAVSLVVVPRGGSAFAASKTHVLDSLLTVTSVRYSPNRGEPRIKVSVKRKRAIPSNANVNLYWKYSLDQRDSRKYDRVNLQGPKGKQTYTLAPHPTVQVARVVIDLRLPHNYERKVARRLVNPRVQYKRFRVSRARAASEALAMHVPGGMLTVAPQSRLLRFAAGTAYGWTVFRDVKTSVVGSGTNCPRLRAGQFVVQRTWYSHNGSTTKVRSRTRIWRSKRQRAASRPPLCDVTGVVGTYR